MGDNKSTNVVVSDRAPAYDWRYDTGEETSAQKADRLAKMLAQEKRQGQRRQRVRQGNELHQLQRRKVRHVSSSLISTGSKYSPSDFLYRSPADMSTRASTHHEHPREFPL